MKTTNVYVTRDSGCDFIEIWPETVGIRKFKWLVCSVTWGAAWAEGSSSCFLYARENSYIRSEYICKLDSKAAFGFIPRKGTAWHIDGKGKRTPVDIEFSN